MTYWRGFSVAASWLLWPLIFVFGSILVSGGPSQCDTDGCGLAAPWWYDAIFLAGVVGPPVALTLWWILWRRRASHMSRGEA